MNSTREAMVKKYGSEEAYRAHMRDIRSKVQNTPGGSFRDVKFAKAMSKKAVAARAAKAQQGLDAANNQPSAPNA